MSYMHNLPQDVLPFTVSFTTRGNTNTGIIHNLIKSFPVRHAGAHEEELMHSLWGSALHGH